MPAGLNSEFLPRKVLELLGFMPEYRLGECESDGGMCCWRSKNTSLH